MCGKYSHINWKNVSHFIIYIQTFFHIVLILLYLERCGRLRFDKKRLGVIVADDSTVWGGEKGLWSKYQERFKYYEDEIELLPIYGVTGKLPDGNEISSFAGFIITGSNYSVNDNLLWIKNLIDFVRYVISMVNGPKLFGICFGHQIIGKALGAKIGLNPLANNIFCTEEIYIDKALSQLNCFQQCFKNRNSFHLMEAHLESILDIPDNVQVVGWSSTCSYEIILWNDRVISTQGHPEFTKDIMVNILGPLVRKHEWSSERELESSFSTFDDCDTDGAVKLVISFLTI